MSRPLEFASRELHLDKTALVDAIETVPKSSFVVAFTMDSFLVKYLKLIIFCELISYQLFIS